MKSTSLISAVLLMRGVLFVGWRFQCPVCGWRVRQFAGERAILRASDTGYCPRCNAKARHRRIWRYLEQRSGLFGIPLRLLEVAPWSSFALRFKRMSEIDYVGVDLVAAGPQVSTRGDLLALPLRSESVDAVLCIHVLEHVADDHAAIAELYRVLKPGGTAIVSVPIRLDQPTFEDPTVTDPQERERLFGERSHVRYYGMDFIERLTAAGFDVSMDPAAEIPEDEVQKYGLRRDENIFVCTKPDRVSELARANA